jgi:hypothetical protein
MKFLNFGEASGFVKKSSSCSFVEIGSNFNIPF